MFIRKNAEFELANSMESNLVSVAVDNKTIANKKRCDAVGHLNAAAELFDAVGLVKEAEYATKLLEMVVAQVQAPAAQNLSEQLKAKLLQSLPKDVGSNLVWHSFNVSQNGIDFQVDGEFALTAVGKQLVSKLMPQGTLVSNYIAGLIKKIVPNANVNIHGAF
jgi:hypothetical protein